MSDVFYEMSKVTINRNVTIRNVIRDLVINYREGRLQSGKIGVLKPSATVFTLIL